MLFTDNIWGEAVNWTAEPITAWAGVRWQAGNSLGKLGYYYALFPSTQTCLHCSACFLSLFINFVEVSADSAYWKKLYTNASRIGSFTSLLSSCSQVFGVPASIHW